MRGRAHILLVTWIVFSLCPGRTTLGTVRLVPEEYPTIQDAVDASGLTDTILVAAGLYQGPGNRDIDFHGRNLLLRSRSGPEETIIDCQWSGRAFYFDANEDDAIIDGLSMIHGWVQDFGGAADIWIAEPTFRNCVFASNTAASGGGGVSVFLSAKFEDCRFVNNYADVGGAAQTIWGSPVFRNCVFTGNGASSGGGALFNHGSDLGLIGCTISRNFSISIAGGLRIVDGELIMDRTICWGNCASNPEGYEIYGNAPGFIDCSDVDLAGVRADALVFGEGVIDSDPLFCHPTFCEGTTGGDYTLQSDSPCLPGANPCQVLIGALGEGCSPPGGNGACCLPSGICAFVPEIICEGMEGEFLGEGIPCDPNPCVPTPTERTTWGRIRGSYR